MAVHIPITAAPSRAPSIQRRNMLAALIAAPAVAPIPSAAACAYRQRWAVALANFHRARSDLEAADAAMADAEERYFKVRPRQRNGTRLLVGDTVETFNARVFAEADEWKRLDTECRQRCRLDAAYAAEDRAFDARLYALDQLLATPAPDLAAVICKIEIAGQEDRDIGALDPIKGDLSRLADAGSRAPRQSGGTELWQCGACPQTGQAKSL